VGKYAHCQSNRFVPLSPTSVVMNISSCIPIQATIAAQVDIYNNNLCPSPGRDLGRFREYLIQTSVHAPFQLDLYNPQLQNAVGVVVKLNGMLRRKPRDLG